MTSVDAARRLTYITRRLLQSAIDSIRVQETIMSFSLSPTRKIFKRLTFVVMICVAFTLMCRPQPRSVIAETLPSSFKSFESPQVHPLALTPDGSKLLAVNTPDHRLSVFQLTGEGLALVAEVPVGLEPVS